MINGFMGMLLLAANCATGDDVLIAAVRSHDAACVAHALEAGAAVDGRDEIGATPLMRALETGAPLDLVERLLEAGADPNAVHGDDEISVLMVAAAYGGRSEVKRLVESGGRVDQVARGGWTALMSAATNNRDTDVIVVLSELGIDVLARDEYGITALMRAAQSNRNPEVVFALLAAGSDPDARDNDGNSALDIAKAYKNDQAVIAALAAVTRGSRVPQRERRD